MNILVKSLFSFVYVQPTSPLPFIDLFYLFIFACFFLWASSNEYLSSAPPCNVHPEKAEEYISRTDENIKNEETNPNKKKIVEFPWNSTEGWNPSKKGSLNWPCEVKGFLETKQTIELE